MVLFFHLSWTKYDFLLHSNFGASTSWYCHAFDDNLDIGDEDDDDNIKGIWDLLPEMGILDFIAKYVLQVF